MSTTPMPWEEAGQQKPPWEEAAPAPFEPAHIGVNRGPMTESPGYQYSKGYAGPNDQPRDSGGFIDRATTQFARTMQDPKNFIPPWHSVLGPLDPYPAIDAYHEWQAQRSGAPAEDPAKKAGNLGIPALMALVTHAGDAVPNLGEAAGSEVGYQGVAHPLEGMARAIRSIPRPDLLRMVKDPIGAGWNAVKAIPEAVKAGLGEEVRIQPKPRPAPAWQTAPTEGTPVPSILERPAPTGNWNVRPRPQIAPPETPVPPGSAGSMVDSIRESAPVDRPPTPEEAANNARFLDAIKNAKTARPAPNAMSDQMAPNIQSLWQESAGFEKPPEDIGAKVRAANPEPTRAEVKAAQAKPQVAAPGEVQWPPNFKPSLMQRPAKLGIATPEDVMETKAIQERVREAAEGEDRARLSREKREWFARNAPGQTKGELVKGATARGRTPEVAAPSEDLTEPWTQALEDLKAKKGKKTSKGE